MTNREKDSLHNFLELINAVNKIHYKIRYSSLSQKKRNAEWIQVAFESIIDKIDQYLQFFISSENDEEEQGRSVDNAVMVPSVNTEFFNLSLSDLDKEFSEDLQSGRISEDDYKDQLEDEEDE